MNTELNQELKNIPIYYGKLVSGELIIGRLQNGVLINCLKVNANYDIMSSSFNMNLTPILYPLSNSLEIVPLNNIILLKEAESNIVELYVKHLLVYVNNELTKNTSQLNEKVEELKNNQKSEDISEENQEG